MLSPILPMRTVPEWPQYSTSPASNCTSLATSFAPAAAMSASYRWSTSPLTFNAAADTQTVLPTGGAAPGGALYHTYYDGNIYMSVDGNANLFVNTDGSSTWTQVDVGQVKAYSRCWEIITVDGQDKLMITSGGTMVTSGNVVEVGVITPP